MEQQKHLDCGILSSFPPLDGAYLDKLLAEQVSRDHTKLVVLDDDPTGVQTVHDLPVYTDWRRETLESGLTEEAIAASENQRSSSLIYSLYMMGNTMPLADQVYILQSNVIKELAEKGPCVILGRCGDYVLRNRKDVLRTFVFAPIEHRIAIAKARPDAKDMPDRLWETTLAKHDRARASYYNYYTENHWGEAKNYDLCLNAALGRDVCSDLIVQAAKALEATL